MAVTHATEMVDRRRRGYLANVERLEVALGHLAPLVGGGSSADGRQPVGAADHATAGPQSIATRLDLDKIPSAPVRCRWGWLFAGPYRIPAPHEHEDQEQP
jgi:hypothetical protein